MNRKSLLFTIFLLALLLFLTGCGRRNNQEASVQDSVKLEERQMQSVCELATLECYYHNTAKLTSEKKVLFWNTSKTLWIEYSGIVKVGVDVSKLEMRVEDTVVTIAIPDAKVLSCQVDETSLAEDSFYSETRGLGAGKIDADDQTKAFQAAQEDMYDTAQEDGALLFQAKLRAQTLLENYVKNIGDVIGVDYEIRWETIEEDLQDSEETE